MFAYGRALALAGLLGVTIALPAAAAEFDKAQKAEIEEIVRTYLLENPNILYEMTEKLQAAEEAEQAEQQRSAILAYSDYLFDDPHSYTAGNPDGDVTIVEFFDYRCGYCQKNLASLTELIGEDKNVRVVLKEFPILGEPSLLASRAALAALQQDDGKHYWEFHGKLMRSSGDFSEENILKLAAESGLDTKKLVKDMDDDQVAETLENNYMVAERIGITGTPAFVVGDRLYRGGRTLDELKEMVAKHRKASAG